MTQTRLPAILETMRAAIPAIVAFGTALSVRRDLLLEILALRHQLAVLGRSDRRFGPADRLLWVCLRRWWPRWQAIRFGNATDEDDGIDAGGGLPGRVSTSSERSDVSEQRSLVEWSLFRQCTSVDGRIGHVHVHHERGEYRGSGRDPPEAPAIAFDAKASRQ